MSASVAALDAVLHNGLIELPALRQLLDTRHDNGIVRARDAAALADGRAESVSESILRVLLVRSGIAVTPQVEVHADEEQSRQDKLRRARLEQAGWQVIVVRKSELYQHPDQLVEAVYTAVSADNGVRR